jgi:hypothetical protein
MQKSRRVLDLSGERSFASVRKTLHKPQHLRRHFSRTGDVDQVWSLGKFKTGHLWQLTPTPPYILCREHPANARISPHQQDWAANFGKYRAIVKSIQPGPGNNWVEDQRIKSRQ